MIFKVLENANPVLTGEHQLVVNTLFILRRQGVVIHQVTPSFFHIKKDTKTVGFACDQLMAIDKAFDLTNMQLPFRIKGLVERRYRQHQEYRKYCNGN